MTSIQKERKQLEIIFFNLMEEGGELIFVEKKEDIIPLIKSEHPDLLLLERSFLDEKTILALKNHSTIWIRAQGEVSEIGEETLFRPFTNEEVLAKSHQLISAFSGERERPM